MKEQELKKDYLLPGQMVSTDHYISRDPGRIYHTKGKLDQSDCSQEDLYLLTMSVVM